MLKLAKQDGKRVRLISRAGVISIEMHDEQHAKDMVSSIRVWLNSLWNEGTIEIKGGE